MNASQQEALKLFRKSLGDVPESDADLLKWLRTRNYNLRKCELLYREAKWTRAVYSVDEYSNDDYKMPGVAEQIEFTSHLGFAKDGTPITYIAMGKADIYGWNWTMSSYEITRYCVIIIERDLRRAREQSKLTGKDIKEITYIIDMDQFSLRHCAHSSVIETGLDLLRMFQDHFPEVWKYVLFVNVPSYFYYAFNLFRPILRHTFCQKFRVAFAENTRNLLLKYIDEDVLPAFLGGKKTDSNGSPWCDEFLKFGGEIPERLCTKNRMPSLREKSGVNCIYIGRNSIYVVPLVVKTANSQIHIELMTEGGSIATSMMYNPHAQTFPALNENLDPETWRLVSPTVKLQIHLSQVDDYCLAPWSGMYAFKFDNSCNVLTSRTLYYIFTVTPPSS